MGETLTAGNAHPVLTIQGHFQNPAAASMLTLRLIRNGEVVKVFETANPVMIQYLDEGFSGGRAYYRLEMEAHGLQVITNPVFVKSMNNLNTN